MFTGLVEEIGTLVEKRKTGLGLRLKINSGLTLQDLQLGSSIAVNGVCLTVVERDKKTFSVDTIEETLKKTNLGFLELNDRVNLERPLKTNDRLGGHFVLGHVDTVGKITNIKALSNSHLVTISFPKQYSKYLIHVGSVAIDGVSMTVAILDDHSFSVGVIPHTWQNTIFSLKKIGSPVNLEFDVLGKYVERILLNKAL